MQEHEQRVVDELNELKSKSAKLLEFFGTDIYSGLSDIEHHLLVKQYTQMLALVETIELRISLF